MASLELKARLDTLLSTAQAETADIDLFATINIQEREECPICMIPLPLDDHEVVFMQCCGKQICMGCIFKNRNLQNQRREFKCLFCRQSPYKNNYINAMRRLMKKNISHAFFTMATKHKNGDEVFQSDTRALEHYIRAAELGHIKALTGLAQCYERGIAVEEDISKALAFYEVSAKKGCVGSHGLLAMFHRRNGDIQMGIKHLKVAASAGYRVTMDDLMRHYKKGFLSKEDLTQTLHAFQASCNEMKSKDRDDSYAHFASQGAYE